VISGPDTTCNCVFWNEETIKILESMVPMGGRLREDDDLLLGERRWEFSKKVLFLIKRIIDVRLKASTRSLLAASAWDLLPVPIHLLVLFVS
jgi:hypothetical protein